MRVFSRVRAEDFARGTLNRGTSWILMPGITHGNRGIRSSFERPGIRILEPDIQGVDRHPLGCLGLRGRRELVAQTCCRRGGEIQTPRRVMGDAIRGRTQSG